MAIQKFLNEYNKTKRRKEDKVLLRIGIDIGPVYILKDLNGQDNVWGPGIILTRRVMDLAGDQNIFCSSRYAEDVRVLSPEYKEIMQSFKEHCEAYLVKPINKKKILLTMKKLGLMEG